jgi:CDP-glucose 4,6-dehydratase
LLTGHTGFKGAWLALWLHRLGAQVTGFSLEPPTTPSLFELAGVGYHMRSVRGDVRDAQATSTAMRESRPEIVFHLAAQSLVRLSYREPAQTYATNVSGTVNVLNAARECPEVRAVVNVTSDKCYENRGLQRGYREDDPLGGQDPYSSSKACAELVGRAFRRSFFSAAGAAGLASARAGNVIGGGDWAEDRLIPDMVRAIAAGQSVRIRNPRAVRPWQHVLEPLHGYLLLAEALYRAPADFSEDWNFGPLDAEEDNVLSIVKRFVERWGQGASWIADDKQHPHEAALLRLDASRAASRLGWRPVLDLNASVNWTVDWYRAYVHGEGMDRQTLSQIDSYQTKVAS